MIALGIDKGINNDLKITIQIATSSSDSSSDSSQSSSSNIYSTECSSINNGISILDNYLSKKISFSHCSAIIFSEDISKDGIKDYINTLTTNPEFMPTCNIIISDSEASKTIECISNSEEDFSAKLYEFVINSADYTRIFC